MSMDGRQDDIRPRRPGADPNGSTRPPETQGRHLGDERIDGAASLVNAGATMVGIALGVLLGLAAGERIEALFTTDRPNQAPPT